MQVNIDDRIPPQLYVAVAELLAWLYRLEQGETKPLVKNCFDTKIMPKILE